MLISLRVAADGVKSMRLISSQKAVWIKSS